MSGTVRLFRDGNQWCALIGPDLQGGIGGFGDTPADALRDLAHRMDVENWQFGSAKPFLVRRNDSPPPKKLS